MESSDLGLLAAPFVAGLLVLATHVPLGIEVLRRGIIFIDLAVAQVAALGVIVAGLFHVDEIGNGAGAQLGAAAAALLAAALLTWTERKWPQIQEALIGLLFVVAAALGILLLAGNPHGGERLRDLLVGQILWVSRDHLAIVALLYVFVIAVLILAPAARSARSFRFYALFAVAVTASVQLVGVFLVFASLIAPAVASIRLQGKKRWVLAFCLGALSYGVGLAASLLLDLPAGAAIVLVLVTMAFGSLTIFGCQPKGGRSSKTDRSRQGV